MDTIKKILIKNFRKSREISDFIELERFIENKRMCTGCGSSIFYKNSLIRMDKAGNVYYDKNFPSSDSYKEVFQKRYYLNFCQKCLSNKFEHYSDKNSSRVFNTLNEITCYAFCIPDETKNLYNKEHSVTLKNMIRRHGESEGFKRWDNYKNLQSIKNKFEYKEKKYGWSEEEFHSFNKSRGITLSNMIKKYGKIQGEIVYNNYVEKQRINGKTIDWFISKYGKEEGEKVFNLMMSKKMQGSKNANSNSGFTSKVSVEFFKKLDLYFNGYKTIHFSNGGEHSVLIENSRYFHLDYFIPDLNLCIEFYGDFFHANPKIYKDPNKILNIYGKVLTVKEIWEKDKRRTELLKERGIKTIIVWESDYYKNKNKSIFFKKILKKCLQN